MPYSTGCKLLATFITLVCAVAATNIASAQVISPNGKVEWREKGKGFAVVYHDCANECEVLDITNVGMLMKDGGGKDLREEGQLGAPLPGPQHHHRVGEDVGHGAPRPGPALKDAGDQAGAAVAHGAGPVPAAPGQVHAQPGGYAGGSADTQVPLGGKDHDRQGGQDTAGGDDVPHQGELRQGDEDGASKDEEAGQLPGGELTLLPPVQPGGEGGAVEVDAGAGEQQFSEEKDHGGDLPAPLSQIDEAGGAGKRRRHHRHEPAALVQLNIEKGEGH